MQTLTLIPIDHDPRMDLVKSCIRGKAVIQELSPDVFFEDIPAAPETGFAPLLFLAAVDDLGMGEDFVRILRRVRALGDGLRGYAAGVILLGSTELDTKNAARELIFALDMAGCAFPERPLAEATGSMRNLRVTQRTHALNDPEEALAFSVESLADRLLSFAPPRFAAPRLLVLHASDRPTSNTLALGDLVLERLDKRFSIRTLSLRNGTANIMAFINRLTSLHVSGGLSGQRLYAVVVSGYSGGDIVAKQAMGALCLNRSFLLPPRFCLMETANDPGEAVQLPGIRQRAASFAAQINRNLLADQL